MSGHDFSRADCLPQRRGLQPLPATAETDQNSSQQNLYSYSVGYDGNNNVTSFNDSVAGSWTITNDALHRVSTLTGTYNGVSGSFREIYDHFGNRNVKYSTYGGTQSQPSPYLNFSAGNNHADSYTYDNAGNLLSDGTNNYLYAAENRICAVDPVASSGNKSATSTRLTALAWARESSPERSLATSHKTAC